MSTWILTQTTTRAIADLAGAIHEAVFTDVLEERLGHGDLSIVHATCLAGAPS